MANAVSARAKIEYMPRIGAVRLSMLIILRLQSSHFAQNLEDTIVILGKIEGLSTTQRTIP
jgi:hypothetical protein